MATPTWTDNVDVITAQVLARGSTARGTIDLRTKFGAFLQINIGRGGTAALTNGVNAEIRRLINNTDRILIAPVDRKASSIAAASSTTVNADSAADQAALNVASVAGFAADDVICIQDSGGGVTRLEFQRVSKTAAGVLTLDRNLKYAHTAAQADTVRNKADSFAPVWVEGGAVIEVVIDYGDDSAGDSVTVVCKAQSLDSIG